MLGQPVSMLIPRVVGVRLSGELPDGSTATDLVLTITEALRATGVVGTFVEFYGPGVAAVPVANRATIGNMSPEYGSTCAIFPIDAVTLSYLRLTGRPASQIALVEAYAKEQGLWHEPGHEPAYSHTLELDLSRIVPSNRRPETAAGPHSAGAGTAGVPGRAAGPRPRRYPPGRAGRKRRRVLPGLRPGRGNGRSRRRPASHLRPGCRRPAAPAQSGPHNAGGRPGRRARPRRRGDRRHHLLHQHLQPRRHDRRRAAGQEGTPAWTGTPPVGENLARPRLPGGHGLSTGPA